MLLTIFKDYSDEQLLTIINECNELDALPKTLNILEYKKQREQLLNIPRLSKLNRFKLTNTLQSVLEWVGMPIDIFWLVISFITLGAAALWIAGFVAGLTVLMAAGLFVYKYQQNKLKERADLDAIELYCLKNHLLDELIYRKTHDLQSMVHTKKIEPRPALKKTSMLLGLSISMMVGFTFYWGVTDILMTLGLIGSATLIAGPIGFAVAGCLAVVAGIYFGIKHYQAKQNINLIDATKKNLNESISKKYYLYSYLKNQPVHKKEEYSLAVGIENQYEPRKIMKDSVSVIKFSIFQQNKLNFTMERKCEKNLLVKSLSF